MYSVDIGATTDLPVVKLSYPVSVFAVVLSLTIVVVFAPIHNRKPYWVVLMSNIV